jgi:hypothetical protein
VRACRCCSYKALWEGAGKPESSLDPVKGTIEFFAKFKTQFENKKAVIVGADGKEAKGMTSDYKVGVCFVFGLQASMLPVHRTSAQSLIVGCRPLCNL